VRGTVEASNTPTIRRLTCVYHKLRFGRIGDAVRRGANVIGCVRFAELGVSVAHLCSTNGAFSAQERPDDRQRLW
jgi:hypothetical protein